MRLGIFAKTFAGTDPRIVLQRCAAAGFRTAQFNWACAGLASLPQTISDEAIASVRAASLASQVDLVAVSGTYNMIDPDRSKRQAGSLALKEIIRTAGTIGARVVTLCTGTRCPNDAWTYHPDNEGPDAWTDLCQALEVALPHAEAAQIDLGIEPEPGNVVSSAKKARQLLDQMRSSRLKVVFDAANLMETGSPEECRRVIDEGLDLLADRVAIAHAKDRLANGTVVAAGQGTIDYRHYIAALRTRGFDGPLITHGLDEGRASEVASFLTGVLKETA